MAGYMGRWAVVNLTAGTIAERQLSQQELKNFLGGSGLGTRLLLEYGSPTADALGPDNPLIFATGPFTGTMVPTAGRHQILAKSPLTGIFGEADAGGYWGSRLKQAGFDGIVFLGQAAKPVYVAVVDGVVQIADAALLWGKDTFATYDLLKETYGEGAETACIGPAGERQVRLASILHDGKDARAAGRVGLGAVMGSKNLKAVVVQGKREIPLADAAALKASIAAIAATVREKTKGMHDYGTAVGVIGAEKIGDLPLKNWQQGSWDKGENISGQRMADTILTKRFYCKSCIIGCGRVVKVDKGRYAGVDGAGPEYETLGKLGANCLVDDLEAIAYGNELCNRYGIDTISTGGVIAYAMEAYEKGLLTNELLDGVLPVWGSAEAMLELVKLIGQGQGIGAFLGHGVRYCAAALGPEGEKFAVHVKGLELPAHDPRAFNSLGIGYATSNRGACHLQGASYFFEKTAVMPEIGITEPLDRFRQDNLGANQADLQNVMCLFDSLKLCKFMLYGGVTLQQIADWIHYVTGMDYTVSELLATGERIFNLKRLFNIRAGVERKDDTLPQRILTEPRPDGGAAGNLPPLAEALAEYYRYRGWDEQGRPRAEKLDQLGLASF